MSKAIFWTNLQQDSIVFFTFKTCKAKVYKYLNTRSLIYIYDPKRINKNSQINLRSTWTYERETLVPHKYTSYIYLPRIQERYVTYMLHICQFWSTEWPIPFDTSSGNDPLIKTRITLYQFDASQLFYWICHSFGQLKSWNNCYA